MVKSTCVNTCGRTRAHVMFIFKYHFSTTLMCFEGRHSCAACQILRESYVKHPLAFFTAPCRGVPGSLEASFSGLPSHSYSVSYARSSRKSFTQSASAVESASGESLSSSGGREEGWHCEGLRACRRVRRSETFFETLSSMTPAERSNQGEGRGRKGGVRQGLSGTLREAGG